MTIVFDGGGIALTAALYCGPFILAFVLLYGVLGPICLIHDWRQRRRQVRA